jgi:hypothetical protein
MVFNNVPGDVREQVLSTLVTLYAQEGLWLAGALVAAGIDEEEAYALMANRAAHGERVLTQMFEAFDTGTDSGRLRSHEAKKWLGMYQGRQAEALALLKKRLDRGGSLDELHP